MTLLKARCLDWVGVWFAIGYVVSGYVLQYYGGFRPCHLCVLQRYLMGGLALSYLVTVFFRVSDSARRHLYMGNGLLACLGASLAARQRWLEHTGLSICTSGMQTQADHWGLAKLVKSIFFGSGECSVGNQFLHMSLASWSILGFGVLILLAGYQMLIHQKPFSTRTDNILGRTDIG
jgi:disulfide bond formation protein DsbB